MEDELVEWLRIRLPLTYQLLERRMKYHIFEYGLVKISITDFYRIKSNFLMLF
jgi:hypothetical protein